MSELTRCHTETLSMVADLIGEKLYLTLSGKNVKITFIPLDLDNAQLLCVEADEITVARPGEDKTCQCPIEDWRDVPMTKYCLVCGGKTGV